MNGNIRGVGACKAHGGGVVGRRRGVKRQDRNWNIPAAMLAVDSP